LGIAAIIISHQTQDYQNFYEAKLQTPTTTLNLNLAETQQQQSRGLGGCSHIPPNAGMYFPFPANSRPVFWMKNMRIPIDIVWLNKDQVVGIEKAVQPPQNPNKNLTQYPAP